MNTIQMKTVEQRQWCHSGDCIVNCEHISHFANACWVHIYLKGKHF